MEQIYSEKVKLQNPVKTGLSDGSKIPLLDTLAQPRNFENKTVTKNGLNVLEKRAFAKHITNEILFPLIDLNSKLKDAYWNTFHCVNNRKIL